MAGAIHVTYTNRPSFDRVAEVLDHVKLPDDPKARIAIKPNLVLAKPSDSGATTDPVLVEHVIRYLRERAYERIKIIESSWVGDSTRRAFRVCGYEEIAKKYGIPLVDLKRDETVRVKTAGLELEVCREALETDFLINMPVLKAHCQTRLTCALKNLKGCIPDREKRRFHSMGLHKPIAALAKAIKTHLVIVDGVIGDLTFEEGGTPVHMGRIIVGEDPVLVDTYAAQLLGYSPEDIPYIPMAQELGVGSTDLTKAQIVEHNKAEASFIHRPIANRLTDRLARYIDARSACSACYGSLVHALIRFEDSHGPLPSDLRIAIGQGFRDNPKSQAELGVGTCTKTMNRHVPGCPPTASDILSALEDFAGTLGRLRHR